MFAGKTRNGANQAVSCTRCRAPLPVAVGAIIMKSKAEIIRTHLAGKTVLDIGGTGYGQPNAYERELAEAWSLCERRICVDYSEKADISVDLNALPLPKIDGRYEIATAFDV